MAVRIDGAAGDGQHQHHRVLGDAQVVGAVDHHHRDVARRVGGDVHRVEADAVAGDDLQPRRRIERGTVHGLQPAEHGIGRGEVLVELLPWRIVQRDDVEIAARLQHGHPGGVEVGHSRMRCGMADESPEDFRRWWRQSGAARGGQRRPRPPPRKCPPPPCQPPPPRQPPFGPPPRQPGCPRHQWPRPMPMPTPKEGPQ